MHEAPRRRRRGRRERLRALADPVAAAEEAGLVYAGDAPGAIRRVARGRGTAYLRDDGARVDAATRRRIEALAIPPAWRDVRIAQSPRAHLQATGRDARGRKQYLYHPEWHAVRDAAKFERTRAFGEALPAIRAEVDHDLQRRDLSRPRVVAAMVRLLDRTLARVGNAEYARANDSFGLTTLREDHVEAGTTLVRLRFRGKAGKEQEVELRDARAARVVRRCQELPGQRLFRWVDRGGDVHDVRSDDVNEYLRGIAGPFTAKDFRTWGASVAALALLSAEPARPESAAAADAAIRASSATSPVSSATRRPSAARATSTRSSSRPTAPATCPWPRCRRSRGSTRTRPPSSRSSNGAADRRPRPPEADRWASGGGWGERERASGEGALDGPIPAPGRAQTSRPPCFGGRRTGNVEHMGDRRQQETRDDPRTIAVRR